MKHKFIIIFSCLIILGGVIQSLYWSATDYGLRSGKIPPFLAAQVDDTSFGGDSTNDSDCDNIVILCKSKMHTDYFDFTTSTDNHGYLNSPYASFGDLIPNTVYTVTVRHDFCISADIFQTCDTRLEGYRYKGINIGYGDSTNGDSTN